MNKTWPILRSDEEAERFVEEADLSEYDFSEMVPMTFRVRDGDAETIDLPAALMLTLKEKAAGRGLTSEQFIREALEAAVQD